MVLKYRDRGDEVYRVTELLVEAGLLDEPKRDYDNEVRSAVRAFQSHNIDPRGRPLEVDGKVGPLTLWSLENEDQSVAFTPVDDSWYDILDELDMDAEDDSVRLRNNLVRVALEEMRAGAGEVGGNNQGPWVAKYLRMPESALTTRHAWCAGFASWCLHTACDELGLEPPIKYTGGARRIRRMARKSPHMVTYGEGEGPQDWEPITGDFVVWWRESKSSWKGHVGIVHSFKNGILYVIEGNRGRYPSSVRVYDYVYGRIPKLLGFARISL